MGDSCPIQTDVCKMSPPAKHHKFLFGSFKSTINLKPRLHGGALSLYMDIKGVERER